jgi:hypothetical protein
MSTNEPKTTAGAPGQQPTWNTPEDIARHREMTPEERLRKTIKLSQAALRFVAAGRSEDPAIEELEALHRRPPGD